MMYTHCQWIAYFKWHDDLMHTRRRSADNSANSFKRGFYHLSHFTLIFSRLLLSSFRLFVCRFVWILGCDCCCHAIEMRAVTFYSFQLAWHRIWSASFPHCWIDIVWNRNRSNCWNRSFFTWWKQLLEPHITNDCLKFPFFDLLYDNIILFHRFQRNDKTLRLFCFISYINKSTEIDKLAERLHSRFIDFSRNIYDYTW